MQDDNNNASDSGASIVDDTGNNLNGTVAVESSASAPQTSVDKMPTKKPILLAVLGVLLLAAIAAAAYFLVMNNSSDDSNAAITKPVESLNVGIVEADITFYPENAIFSSSNAVNIQMFEGLVTYEDLKNIRPALATSWTNPDSKTWDFELKQNVMFHNGELMTADDVVASFELAQENQDIADIFLGTIDSVTKQSDTVVRIVTTEPDPVLLNKLAFVYIVDPETYSEGVIPAGTGHYLPESADSYTDQMIQMKAFESYHEGPVTGVQKLKIAVYPDAEAGYEAYNNDEIDVLEQTGEAITDGSVSREYETFGYSDLGANYLGINSTKEGPLSNLQVREAIRLAVDPQKLIEETSSIEGVVANQLLASDIPGYSPEVVPAVSNAEKSKELLSEAGYPDGITVELTYFVSVKDVAQGIQKQLAEAGITATLDEQTDGPSIGAKVFGGANGGAQLWLAGFTSDINDASDAYAALFDDSANFSDEQISSQLATAYSTLDGAERLNTLQQVSKELIEKVAYVPLYRNTYVLAYDNENFVFEQSYPGALSGIKYANFQVSEETSE